MRILQSKKTIHANGSRPSNTMGKTPRIFQGTATCPLAPGPTNLVGHWFNPCKGTFPTITGEAESTIGDRSGEAYSGRGYKGDGIGYIDLSDIPGVVTAFTSFKKDEFGNLNANNLTHIDYKNGVLGNIPMVVNSSKDLILENGCVYHGIPIFKDGVFYDYLNCEEGTGTASIGKIKKTSYPIINIESENIHIPDTDIVYSFLNEEGWGYGSAIDFSTLETEAQFDNIINPLNASSVSTTQIRYGVSGFNAWIRNKRGTTEYLDLSGKEYVPGITPLSNMGGFYNDNDGLGYYATVYSTPNSDSINFRDMGNTNPIKSAAYNLRVWSLHGVVVNLKFNDLLNIANNYFASVYAGEGSGILVPSGSFFTYNSAKIWYDYLVNLNRESEMDDLIFPYWDATFQDHYDAAQAAYNGTIPDSIRTFSAFQIFVYKDYPSGLLDIKEVDMICNTASYSSSYSLLASSFFEGKSIGEVDHVAISAAIEGQIKLYLDGNGIRDGAQLPINPGTNKTSGGFETPHVGRVKLKAQLVEAPCFESDGIAQIDFDQLVNKIEVNGIDITNEVSFIGNIGTVNIGVQLFDMVINDVHHYPVNDFDNLTVPSSNGGPLITISNALYGDILSTQDVYHYHAVGEIKSRTIKETSQSKIKFPECPRIRSVGIDPEVSYFIHDFQNWGVPYTYWDNSNYLKTKNLLIYNIAPTNDIHTEALKFTNS